MLRREEGSTGDILALRIASPSVPVLLIASAGGHLKELHALVPRLGPHVDRLWVTFDNAMSRSLLEGEQVQYVPYVHPRDVRHLAANVPIAREVCRRVRPSAAISTGSGVALVWLPVARRHGAAAHFVETATRTAGPSICGRLLLPYPGVHVYSQYESWAGGHVHYGGSVFDGFAARPVPAGRVSRVLVTVGTSEAYGFERLIRRLLEILPAWVEVVWQVGLSDVPELGDRARRSLPVREIEAAHRWADVVVAHAGVGSAATALSLGRLPVLVPRRRGHREHVDDHQTQVAAALGSRGLAVVGEADELTLGHLESAAAHEVERTDPPPFALVGGDCARPGTG